MRPVAANSLHTPRAARAWWWSILLLAALLRIALFSGYGLGDDPGYFACYHDILLSGQWNPERAYDWRFAFWVPVVWFMRVLGVTEWGFVGFVFCAGLVNVVLVWALARQECEEPWVALVAMALMAVLPLEVLSSTLFVIDIPLATWCFAAFWLYREACAPRHRRAVRVVAAISAGFLLFLAYSTKQWGVLVGAIFAVETLRRPRTTWRASALCGATFGLVVAAYLGWQWLHFGDPVRDVHIVRKVAIFLPHSWDIVTDYSRMLLGRNELGTWFAGWYLHATLVLAAVFLPRLRQAGIWLGYFLILLTCLSAMPSHRESGQWVLLVPHIFRYLCFLSIPLCLALASYVCELVRWWPALGAVATAGFLMVSVAQAVALTAPTRDVFGEQRQANALLLALFPDERFVSDFGFLSRLRNFYLDGRAHAQLQLIMSEDPDGQARELAEVSNGVVITGGGRLPWYGCLRCALTLERFQPGPAWRLVTTLEGPLGPYRKEPLRIWRVSAAAQRADALLKEVLPETARAALLGRLAEAGDWALAVEVGRRLVEAGVEPAADVARLTGLACARTNRPRCARTRLARVLEDAPDAKVDRETVVALASAAQELGDGAAARALVARYRARYPRESPDARLDDIASGISDAIARYQALRYREAEPLFAAIRDRDGELPERRQRAHYFHALTLFRMRHLDRANAEAESYRSRYGEDDTSIELAFRDAEARRPTDPAGARARFEALAERHPNTYWGREARRLAAEIEPPAGASG